MNDSATAARVCELILQLSSPDVSDRWNAALYLGLRGEEGEDVAAAIPLLIKTLADKDIGVRDNASLALRRIGTKSVPALIKALEHENKTVRANAAETLGKIGARTEKVIAALILTLQDREPMPGIYASKALAKIGERALPHLIKALKNPDSMENAACALGELGERALLPVLRALREGNILQYQADRAMHYIQQKMCEHGVDNGVRRPPVDRGKAQRTAARLAA